MALALTLDELLAWTAEERAKWLPWFKANPAALALTMQAGGRFPTVASLVDHIFLVEVRHTLRVQRRELPTSTGVSPDNVDGLWAYAARGRQAAHELLKSLSEKTRRRRQSGGGDIASMTPRLLMGLHEVRHWAQIAAVVAWPASPPGTISATARPTPRSVVYATAGRLPNHWFVWPNVPGVLSAWANTPTCDPVSAIALAVILVWQTSNGCLGQPHRWTRSTDGDDHYRYRLH